jgi:NAD(P)-dependent dehydrogenase (short-subunit alcohol dehydrogenase family)
MMNSLRCKQICKSIKRSEEVSDLVGAVSFIASDDAAFITGQTLYVNGGITRTT